MRINAAATTAANVYYDINSPPNTPRPSVLTIRKNLGDAINRRQTMYAEYGVAEMYFSVFNEQLEASTQVQIDAIQAQDREINIEVAVAEYQAEFTAAYNNAYIPYAPSDYTLSAYQWYEASINSQHSDTEVEGTHNQNPFKYRRERGTVFYELSNHLGNVLVTVTDMKEGIGNGSWTASYYYPFGMLMSGRKFNDGGYRFGFSSV